MQLMCSTTQESVRAAKQRATARRAPSKAVMVLLVALFGAVLGIVTQLHAKPLQPVAAVFPLWWSHQTAFAAAAQPGVVVLAEGPMPNVIIVQARDLDA